MDINTFPLNRPYLYHLTDRRNLDSILADKQLKCTKLLTELSHLPNAMKFLTTKRHGHKEIKIGTRIFYIRDQNPILEKVLKRSLDKDCTYEDFLLSLNSRVFFWPTIKDLSKHFGTYKNENPIILRLNTQEIFEINNPPKFCNLNSGATRCVAYYKGNAAPRGHRTFLSAEESPYNNNQIREVTFENYCTFPSNIYVSNNPEQPFTMINK